MDVPVYDFKTHSRYFKSSAYECLPFYSLDITQKLYGANVVVFEGIFALYDKRVLDLMDLKV